MTNQSNTDTVRGWNSEVSIPGRFEEIAEQFASLEAVRSPHSIFSYQKLEKDSRRLASILFRKLGSKASPVALLLEDGAQVIASLLGVVRSGHFYCALSHRDPPSRLIGILEDLDARLLVTDLQSLSLAKQIAPPGCEILLLSDLPDMDESPLPIDFVPKTLLGIFYTSGSTGEQKGVIRTHSFVLNRLWVDIQDHAIDAGDRLLYMKQFYVSSSLSSIFDALLTGATLIIYPAEFIGIGQLAELITNVKITVFTPPIELLRRFLDSLDEDIRFSTIRLVILGGDVLFRRDVERLRSHLSEQAVVVHHLSSSESGLLARTILHHDTPIAADIVPVGFPVPGKEILILDEDGKQLRDGVAGEIAVRSEIIFPGYWRQPEQSAAKFRPDPDDPTRKIFCTGDLGYFLPDGQLVFLGRKDFRVKIRGFSVDCASVESALMANPQVKRAVVLAQVDPAGQKRLVAYVLCPPESPTNASDLRTFLLESIPAYMIPSVFVFLPELPLTTTIKVARKALPPPDWSQVPTSASYAAPGDEVEQKLALIWQRLLSLERVGINDSWFDIGGDSLSAMVLFLEIERALGVELPLRTLIDHETIRQIVPLIRDPNNTSLHRLVTYNSSGNGLPVFLIPHGKGDAMGMRTLAMLLEGKQPVYGLQAAGMDGENLYKQPMEEVAAIFIEAIRKAQPSGPYRLVGGSAGGWVAYEMACRLRAAGEAVDLLGLIDTSPPGPRGKAPLNVRLGIQWQNLRSLPLKKYPEYVLKRSKGHMIELARSRIFRNLFTVNTLNVILGKPDVKKPGRAAHILYYPRPYPGDVVYFKVKNRPQEPYRDPVSRWRKFIKGKITVVEVDGDHASVYSLPDAAGLAKEISTFL